MEKVKCDNCIKLRCHPSGVSETCQAIRDNTNGPVRYWTDDDFYQRFNGDIMTCKHYRPIRK
jgi:hypothetical protein